MLTQIRLKELLHYDPDTGGFNWLVTKNKFSFKNAQAGGLNKSLGYILIGVDQKRYYAHRLAWLYMYGEFPAHGIDHINRNRADNSLRNLRAATQAENMQNCPKQGHNTSGHTGVSWMERDQKWRAYIMVNKKQISLGYFAEINDAISAYASAKARIHTFHPTVIK